MVIWRGVLKLKPGKRDEYITAIRNEKFIEKFTKQPGNLFYSVGASIADDNSLIVMDGWNDRAAFEAHDTSSEVDVWREIYGQYVVDCESSLYEF